LTGSSCGHGSCSRVEAEGTGLRWEPWLSSEASTRRRSASRSKRSDSVVKRIPFGRATHAAEFLPKGARPFLPSAGRPPHRELHGKASSRTPQGGAQHATSSQVAAAPSTRRCSYGSATWTGASAPRGVGYVPLPGSSPSPAAIPIPRATRSSTPSSSERAFPGHAQPSALRATHDLRPDAVIAIASARWKCAVVGTGHLDHAPHGVDAGAVFIRARELLEDPQTR
jgi:hypothetical protein